MGFRTLRVEPAKLLDLLRALSLGSEVRIDGPGISRDAALGPVTWNEHTQLLEIKVVAREKDWPDEGPYLDLAFSCRYSDAGVATDWGARIPLGPADA